MTALAEYDGILGVRVTKGGRLTLLVSPSFSAPETAPYDDRDNPIPITLSVADAIELVPDEAPDEDSPVPGLLQTAIAFVGQAKKKNGRDRFSTQRQNGRHGYSADPGFRDFNREFKPPKPDGKTVAEREGTLILRADDDFWVVAALPWQFRFLPTKSIVAILWPGMKNVVIKPDSLDGIETAHERVELAAALSKLDETDAAALRKIERKRSGAIVIKTTRKMKDPQT